MPVFIDTPTLGWRINDKARTFPLASSEIGKDLLFEPVASRLWVLTDTNTYIIEAWNTSSLTVSTITPAQGGERFALKDGFVWINKGSIVTKVDAGTHIVSASIALGVDTDGQIVAGASRLWVARVVDDTPYIFGGVDIEFSDVLTSSTLTDLAAASTFSTVLTVSGADFGTGCSYAASNILGTDLVTMGQVASNLTAHFNSLGARVKIEINVSNLEFRNASPLERPYWVAASVTDDASGSALFGDMTDFSTITQVAGVEFAVVNDELYGIEALNNSVTAAIDVGGNILPNRKLDTILFSGSSLYVLRAQDRDFSACQFAGAQLIEFDDEGTLTTTIDFSHTGTTRIIDTYGLFQLDPVASGQFYILGLENIKDNKPTGQFRLFVNGVITSASVRAAFRGYGGTFGIVSASDWWWSLTEGGQADPFVGMNLIGSFNDTASPLNVFMPQNPLASAWGSNIFLSSTLGGYNLEDIQLISETTHSEASAEFTFDLEASGGNLSYEKMLFAASHLFLLRRVFNSAADLISIENPNALSASATRINLVSVDGYTDITLS